MNLMVNFCLVNRAIKRLYIVFPVLSLISYSIINSTKVSAIYFCHADILFDFNKQRFLEKSRDHDLWNKIINLWQLLWNHRVITFVLKLFICVIAYKTKNLSDCIIFIQDNIIKAAHAHAYEWIRKCTTPVH